jgi:protocatechuate 4,5-dioxygenase alpha chain
MMIQLLILVNQQVKLKPIEAANLRQTMTTSKQLPSEPGLNPIPGTTLFDGVQAQKGYALNKMCFSFNSADNRAAFQADEEAYMQRFKLNDQQILVIRNRDVPGLLEAGGNVYYLAKFAGILGLDVQDLGSLQTGMSKADFVARLLAQANQPDTLIEEPTIPSQAV